ncbi:MAG: ABC transporter permease, partial [Syntrophomonadaceae bacterium]|nr:ABC transporter permease [Syntrophomonadaceae bacterium]
MTKAKQGFLISLIIPLIFVVVWWVCALRVNNPVILPEVKQVFALLSKPTENLISMGSLLSNILVRLIRVRVGYIFAVIVAIPWGIMMGYYSLVFNLFNNFLGLFRP